MTFGFMDLADPTDPDPDPKHWLKLWVLIITFSTHACLNNIMLRKQKRAMITLCLDNIRVH